VRREVVTCDACGREISAVGNGLPIMLTFSKPGHTQVRQLDVCQYCLDDLDRWLEGSTPIGYELVPIPCPHNIPCADPEGCSGKMLVRRGS